MSAVGTHIGPELVDRLMELYCDWRTECAEVHAAYERFLRASPSDRAAAFGAYAEAIDREESACESYAAQVRLLQARFNAAGAGGRQRERDQLDRP